MMFGKFDNHKPYFRGVALATLLAGAVLVALGGVELILNLWGNDSFTSPVFKIIGGLAVLSLGYIHLELEMMRVK
jgi:hypothetical protein